MLRIRFGRRLFRVYLWELRRCFGRRLFWGRRGHFWTVYILERWFFPWGVNKSYFILEINKNFSVIQSNKSQKSKYSKRFPFSKIF
jgi:hypothetical protein